MSFEVMKLLKCNGTRALRSATHNFVRTMASTDEPCSGKQTEPPKPKEPCSAKAEPSPPSQTPCSAPKPPPPQPSSTCPKPPPCPPMPQCPPTICPPFIDNNNPCNYVPPPYPDPELPDMTRMKKLQCFFQEDNDIPIYRKKGNADGFLNATTYISTFIGCVIGLYVAFTVKK